MTDDSLCIYVPSANLQDRISDWYQPLASSYRATSWQLLFFHLKPILPTVTAHYVMLLSQFCETLTHAGLSAGSWAYIFNGIASISTAESSWPIMVLTFTRKRVEMLGLPAICHRPVCTWYGVRRFESSTVSCHVLLCSPPAPALFSFYGVVVTLLEVLLSPGATRSPRSSELEIIFFVPSSIPFAHLHIARL